MDQKPVVSFPLMNGKLAYLLSLFILLSSLALFNVIKPFQPQSLLAIDFLSQIFLNNRNAGHGIEEACDYSYGNWVWDESVPLRSYNEDCPFSDRGFKCQKNGRMDDDFLKWRWQPYGCDLPRFNASDMLERSRDRRIVFAGDSIGRNQWESLVCMLAQAVSNQSTIYEVNGNPITKHKGYLSVRFSDYNLTVEYYRLPFLVPNDRPPVNSPPEVRCAIHVDKLHWESEKWIGADVLVFNAGHWWNHEKTFKMGCYFQEGEALNLTMTVEEAFRRSIQAWKRWVIANLEMEKSYIFFRSYSPVHFRGNWGEGGACDNETAPETNHSQLQSEPWNNIHISNTVKEMNMKRRNVQLLNITYLTNFRRDGHPSNHREQDRPAIQASPVQDCSHWCLPGVPDTWNELLYGYLLSNGYSTKNNRQEMQTD